MSLEEEASWMTPYVIFMKRIILSEDVKEVRKIQINAPNYTIYDDRLYRRGYSTPWLKCITSKEAEVVIQ